MTAESSATVRVVSICRGVGIRSGVSSPHPPQRDCLCAWVAEAPTWSVAMEFHLADLFDLVVDTIPDRPALIAADRSLTFKEVDERANRLAQRLTDSGIRSGDHVAIQAWNRADGSRASWLCSRSGPSPINVNYPLRGGRAAGTCSPMPT